MTLQIDLQPETESRLRGEAAKHRLDTDQHALCLIEQSLPPRSPMGGHLWHSLGDQ